MTVLVGTEKQIGLESFEKTTSDGADMMWRGKSFQMVAPETGHACMPTVEGQTVLSLTVPVK